MASQLFILLALCAVLASAEDTMTSIEGAITVTHEPEGCKDGRLAKAGDTVAMHYVGKIDESSASGTKGKQFDKSSPDSPFKFQLGVGQVIKGWDQGVVGMCVGEKRTLVVPPDLGYGSSGAGADIPGGATLNFEIECVDILDGEEIPNLFKIIDENEDEKLSPEEINAWFQKEQGGPMPDELMEHEDKDKDGFVSWSEFSGPKGDARDEL